MNQIKRRSAMATVLRALIPYNRENLLLSFKPNQFFKELEANSRYNRNTLKNAYWRGQQKGYINKNIPRLTVQGLSEIKPFMAVKLGHKARLMVIFDVPEKNRKGRQKLRELLKFWEFRQIQKSVWESDKDYKELLVEAIVELRLSGCVEIYESLRLFPKH